VRYEKKDGYTVSSGNIYADLGFHDAEERMAKVDLAIEINHRRFK
jgi:hypothetical protein